MNSFGLTAPSVVVIAALSLPKQPNRPDIYFFDAQFIIAARKGGTPLLDNRVEQQSQHAHKGHTEVC